MKTSANVEIALKVSGITADPESPIYQRLLKITKEHLFVDSINGRIPYEQVEQNLLLGEKLLNEIKRWERDDKLNELLGK